VLPSAFQDRYLFEALAVRNNVFMGSAAMYSLSPQLAQQFAACRVAASAGSCESIREFVADWVKSALAVQLSTFPIG